MNIGGLNWIMLGIHYNLLIKPDEEKPNKDLFQGEKPNKDLFLKEKPNKDLFIYK